jgi:hypothetical protein
MSLAKLHPAGLTEMYICKGLFFILAGDLEHLQSGVFTLDHSLWDEICSPGLNLLITFELYKTQGTAHKRCCCITLSSPDIALEGLSSHAFSRLRILQVTRFSIPEKVSLLNCFHSRKNLGLKV